jgi:predicted dehydrogenase
MSYSVLLVGLGQVALGYDLEAPCDKLILTHARAFAMHPAFQLAGGVDPDEGRRDLFAQHYGITADADIVTALVRIKPDVVVIAAPTQNHGELLRTVLRHSAPRAVLCEKPLSYDLTEARDMVRLCEATGCRLYVNYPRRAAPGEGEVKRRFTAGGIAKPVKGSAWYSKGLLHSGSHFVDLLDMWLGPICGFTVLDPGRWRTKDDPEPDVRIDFASGSITFLAAREEDFSLYEIDLIAPNGRLRYTQGGGKIAWYAAAPDPLFKDYTVLAEAGENIPSNGHLAQWHVAVRLAALLDGEEADLCSGGEALQSLEWIIKIRDAL